MKSWLQTRTSTYVCSRKHNYIPYIPFTITMVQLHVSAINVGHRQVVHEAPYDKLYLHLSGGTICGGGVGARSRFVFVKGVWIGSIYLSWPGIIDARAWYQATARRLRNAILQSINV